MTELRIRYKNNPSIGYKRTEQNNTKQNEEKKKKKISTIDWHLFLLAKCIEM